MQQELIEMLEEIIQYVEVWNAHDQGILDKAEALVEKAKKSAKEPAVPQGEPVGVVYSFPSGDGNTAWGFKPNDSAWEVEKQPKSYERRFNVYLQAAHAAPSQPVTLTDERLREIDDAHNWQTTEGRMAAYRAITAALREKQVAKLDYESMYCWLTDGKRGDWIWNHVLTDEEKSLGNDIDAVVITALREKEQAK